MRDVIRLEKVNELHLKVVAEPSLVQELSDVLTFTVPGAKFMPAVRNKFWDGKIRLLNSLTGLTYAGLVNEISAFCKIRDYQLSVDDKLLPETTLTDDIITKYLEYCKLNVSPRDYQLQAFRKAVESDRGVFLSPTASGKSLIIYLLTQYYNSLNQKVLIVVPTTSLVLQMKTDFESYTKRKLNIHCITAGVDKESTENIVVSTWQSIYKMPKQWFNQFGCVIGDEAHQFKAKSLTSIMEKMVNCRYRFGFTGTLDGSLTNKITLEGLFGPVQQVTTTTDLMEQKHVAELKIKCIILHYSDQERKDCKNLSYSDEVDFLVRHVKRNKFLRNLALSLEGNTLVLFQFVEKHGKLLYDIMKAKDPDRPIFFIHGGIDADQREAVRTIVEQHNNAVIVASYGTFSTGVNIRNLHNVVFSSPTKSRIRTLQSIGRGLRISSTKDKMVLYDIADNLQHKTHTNFTLQHFSERLNIYSGEGFEFKIYNTTL